MKNIFKTLFGKKEISKGNRPATPQTTDIREKPLSQTAKTEEKEKYSISLKIASVMGNSVYAIFKGYSNTGAENHIMEHFSKTDYLDFDEIPVQFKMCKVYYHKKIDIHEAAAIMNAEQKAEPSANTRIDSSGSIAYYPTDVKNCQTQGQISWPGGSIKITRILLPSIEDDRYNLVIINS
jgi:hypothetical protein